MTCNDVIVFLDFFFFPFSLAPRCAYISVGWLPLLEIFEYPTFVTNILDFLQTSDENISIH